ncbi:FixH family protein [Bacillus sp. EAC]|uniref:FixH family protein n=1 Tax=Bacillus sp. EAC TaxID=1978338 RepID=UPI000B42F24C|nr:FixH family protein [Bacillus sp. EAC]
MKNLQVFSLMITCFVLIITGCSKKEEVKSSPFLDKINVSLTDLKSTKNKDKHTYQVKLVNRNGEKVDVDSVKLNLQMKSMNHHSEGVMKRKESGLYEVQLELPMDGTWSKQVVLKNDKNERKVNLRGNSNN